MPPVLPRPVFLGRVLRVVDDEVGVGQETSVTAVALVQDRFEGAGRGVAAPERAAERLVVAPLDDRGALGPDPVAERHGGGVVRNWEQPLPPGALCPPGPGRVT